MTILKNPYIEFRKNHFCQNKQQPKIRNFITYISYIYFRIIRLQTFQ